MKLSKILFSFSAFLLINNFQEDLLNNNQEILVIENKDNKDLFLEKEILINELSDFFSKSFNESNIEKIKEEINYCLEFSKKLMLNIQKNNLNGNIEVIVKSMRDSDLEKTLNDFSNPNTGSIEDAIKNNLSKDVLINGAMAQINQNLNNFFSKSIEELKYQCEFEKNDFLKLSLNKYFIEIKEENSLEKIEEFKNNLINYYQKYMEINFDKEYIDNLISLQIEFMYKIVEETKKELELRKKENIIEEKN